MIRQRQRKAIEELYGSKYDASKSQATAPHQNNGQKTGRTTDRDYGYMITSSNNAYNGAAQPPSAASTSTSKPSNLGKETSRRKSARPSNKTPNEKHFNKESIGLEDGRRSPAQATKSDKLNHVSPALTNVYDNKSFGTFKDNLDDDSPHHQHHHYHHNHHNHHHNNIDEDKDDDTDEFFELIRRTVDSAIGKSISELLNRNFRELSTKVERFSSELKNTNALLNQLQIDLNNRIGHYGEENSRHFRYLCMKSEYDKMFYQHQTLIATAKPPNVDTPFETKKTEKRKISPKISKCSTKVQRQESDKPIVINSCPCHSTKCKSPTTEFKEPHISSSGEISQKSSEVGMREVLEQIQKYCTQMQFNGDPKCEVPGTSQQRNIMRHEDLIQINKEIFAEDDDADEDDEDWDISSEGVTPRNRSKESHKYGGTTSRGGLTQRANNGAGDG